MKKIITLLLILPFTCICIAQSTQPNELHFNRLLVKNGLPIDAVFTSLQDKEGYMWIGTQAGLVRYDGYTCKVYQFGIDPPLNAGVGSIYEDHAGELWIGTIYKGLYHYIRATDSFVHYINNSNSANRLDAGRIESMHDDRNENLWMILSDLFGNNYLNFFDTKKHQFKQFGISEKGNRFINASKYFNLFEDSKGRIWIGTNNGIYEYSPAGDKFIPHFTSDDPSQQKFIGLQQEDAAHPGTIWMNVWNTKLNKGEGLWRYNTANNTIKTYHHNPNDPTSLVTDSVFIIQKDAQDNMWFRTADGLSVFEPSSERFINYTIKDKKINFEDNSIWQLKEDNAGNFWCFNGGDLLSFNNKTKTFTQYTSNEKEPDALAAKHIFNLSIDRSGTLWIGAYEGLYWLSRTRSKFTVYKNEPGQPHYFPGGGYTSFAEDRDGTFWVWSLHGLYHWYPSSDSFTVVKAIKGNDDLRSAKIITDKSGIVWCSTWGKGLFNYNPNTGGIKNFKNNPKDPTSLSSNLITTLFEDNKAVLWIGTWDGGLCSFNRQTNSFKRYPFIINHINTPNNNALDDKWVVSICEDKQGTIWVGTDAGGLNRFNPGYQELLLLIKINCPALRLS
jgi:ligand-binding sensor domain-containing protein